MAIDRAEALKKAEKLLRQGKIDLAIGEYVKMIDEQPRDCQPLVESAACAVHDQGRRAVSGGCVLD